MEKDCLQSNVDEHTGRKSSVSDPEEKIHLHAFCSVPLVGAHTHWVTADLGHDSSAQQCSKASSEVELSELFQPPST